MDDESVGSLLTSDVPGRESEGSLEFEVFEVLLVVDVFGEEFVGEVWEGFDSWGPSTVGLCDERVGHEVPPGHELARHNINSLCGL